MNVEEQVGRFQNFLEKEYKAKIAEKTRKGEKYLEIDFSDLAKFDPQLAELVLEDPEDLIKAFELAVEQFDLNKEAGNIKIGIFNLPESQKLRIKKIRGKNINKLYTFEVNVSRITDVITTTKSIKYECPQCGNTFSVLQQQETETKPSGCGCGRKGKFKEISRELVDLQKITVEDYEHETDENKKPIMKLVLLEGHLTDPDLSNKLQAGKRVAITGHIDLKPTGKDSVEQDFYIKANTLQLKEYNLYTIELSKKDIERIKKLSKDPKLMDKLIQSISPGTEGMELIRKALVLQHFRSDNVYDLDGKLDDRGTINICLVGSPGTNKTYLARKSIRFNPVNIFTSGRGVSGVGLVGAVTHDKALGAWVLDAGAVPLVDKGIIAIDECDKIEKEDIAYLNNAMNELEVPISKANIRAILKTDVSFLCCANPQGRIFDNYTEKFRQLGLPHDFLDRFDLIFALETRDSEEKRKKVIKKIIKRHRGEIKQQISTDLFTKYIAYTWQNIHPEIDLMAEEYALEAIDILIDPSTKKKTEISYRIIGTILRLAKASARVYLSNKIRKKDIDLAIEIIIESFTSLEMMDESQKITQEKLQMEPPKKIKKAPYIIMDILDAREEMIPAEDLFNISGLESSEFDDVIRMLERSGEIFSPKQGFYKKAG